MTKRIAAALMTGLATSLASVPVAAQAQSAGTAQSPQSLRWIQIEAQPTLGEAEARVRSYAARLDGVNGFRVVGNWYAIVLGPYSEAAAKLQMNSLKSAGLIPQDSFIAFNKRLRQQFWPVGANALDAIPLQVDNNVSASAEPPATTQLIAVETTTTALLPLPDETKREARKSESLLDRDARKELQVALRWGGYYTSAIDGAFGPGTRRSMAAWQTDQGYDPTGILTTRQRAELLASYQEVLNAIGMAPYTDTQAGISIAIPAAMVEFARYEAPFVHFDTKDDSGVQLVLISQTGDQDTLYGLYDIMQSLEIVPLEGPRKRGKNSFTIEGDGSDISSYTHVKLVNGTVKGYSLVWPKGDDKRRSLALNEMKSSFQSLNDTALADTAGLDEATQSLDLLSGLDIRQPDMSRSGFYVDGSGSILTTSEVVQNCERITVNDDQEFELRHVDNTRGLALLSPKVALAPLAHATFLSISPRLKTDVAVAGYSFEGRLNAPSLTFGTLSELSGLNGEAELTRLALAALPGDAGGPVLDAGGAVMGLLLPAQSPAGRTLPSDVGFAISAQEVTTYLTEQGVQSEGTDVIASMDPVDLSAMAADMTVLVSCWN